MKPFTTPQEPTFVERAWQANVVMRPCPMRWAALAQSFVLTRRTKQPEPMLASLLLSLDLATDWPSFLDGGWLQLVTTHRYIYFAGSGFGDARTLQVVERFCSWLREQEDIDARQERWLLMQIDNARESVGLQRKHGRGWRDVRFHRSQIEGLAERFARTVEHPFLRSLAAPAVDTLAAYSSVGRNWARFGALRKDEVLNSLLSDEDPRTIEDPFGSTRTFLTIASAFYRWLASENYLERELAESMAVELGATSLRLVA